MTSFQRISCSSSQTSSLRWGGKRRTGCRIGGLSLVSILCFSLSVCPNSSFESAKMSAYSNSKWYNWSFSSVDSCAATFSASVHKRCCFSTEAAVFPSDGLSDSVVTPVINPPSSNGSMQLCYLGSLLHRHRFCCSIQEANYHLVTFRANHGSTCHCWRSSRDHPFQ